MATYCVRDEKCEEITAAQDRIESLTAELALRKDYADQVRAQSTTIIRLGVELEACERPLRDRIEKLERMLEWIVKHRVAFTDSMVGGPHMMIDGERTKVDGTPASILAAVEKAMEK